MLDTHIALAFFGRSFRQHFPSIHALLEVGDVEGFVSAATLWEIAIKTRLGKLDIGMPLSDLPEAIASVRLQILGIEVSHVLHTLDPEPPTRDPFDRLLLAQCQVEGFELVTVDRALVDHPLAFRP
nr:type II toxin-antitoxin system VapC family toxin [Rhizobium sp. AQ_MP]